MKIGRINLIQKKINTHQVLEVKKGNRMAMITFFVTKKIDSYRIKSHFFDEKNILKISHLYQQETDWHKREPGK